LYLLLKSQLRIELDKNFQRDQESLKRKHSEELKNLEIEFESERKQRTENFNNQISNYMKNSPSLFDHLDDKSIEKRDVTVII
jgi:hypothetical protein